MFNRYETEVQRHEPVVVADGPRGISFAIESIMMDEYEMAIPYIVVTVSKEAPMVTQTQLVSIEPLILHDLCLN